MLVHVVSFSHRFAHLSRDPQLSLVQLDKSNPDFSAINTYQKFNLSFEFSKMWGSYHLCKGCSRKCTETKV